MGLLTGREVRRVILIVVDALAFQRFQRWLMNGFAPVWQRVIDQGWLAPLTSVVPSTTAVALTSLWTGRSPAEFGISGYEMWMKEYGVVAIMILHAPMQFKGEHGSLSKAGFNPQTYLQFPTLGTQRGWERQKEMAAAIAGEIEQEISPLIILGDFNTTDQTENYAVIAGRLTDTHWSIGHGFGFTFPDWQRYKAGHSLLGPLVRIDHILVSRHWVPQYVHVVSRATDSDHLPVVATFRFRD